MSPRPLTSPNRRPQSALPAGVAAAIARVQAEQQQHFGLQDEFDDAAAGSFSFPFSEGRPTSARPTSARPTSARPTSARPNNNNNNNYNSNVGFLVHSLAAEDAVADRRRDRAEAEVMEELRMQWMRSAEGSVPKLPAYSPSKPSRRGVHIRAVVPRAAGERDEGGAYNDDDNDGDDDLAGMYYEDNADEPTAAETVFFSGGQEELAEQLAARLDDRERQEQNPYVLRLADASGSQPPPRPQSAAPVSFRAVDSSAFGPTVEYSKNVKEMQPRPFSARPTSRPWTAGGSRPDPKKKPRPTTAATVSFTFDGPRVDSKTFLRANWLDAYSDKLLAGVGAEVPSSSSRPATASSSRRPASAKVDSWSTTRDVRRKGHVAMQDEAKAKPAVGFPMPARPLSARGVTAVVPASQPPPTTPASTPAPAVVSPGIARLNAWREKIGTTAATMSSAEATQPPKERYEIKKRKAGHGRRHIVNLDEQLTEQFDVRAARFSNAWNPLRTHED